MIDAAVRIGSQTKTQAIAWVFFMSALSIFFFPLNLNSQVEKRPIVEEMSKEDKTEMLKALLAEGDRLAEQKDYNLANATYESVFLIEPGHVETSKRIDRLKKTMVKEGVSETQLVTRVYDEEIGARVRLYLTQAKKLIETGKLAQARFSLQKLLLIDPLHDEANQLYKQVNQNIQKRTAQKVMG